MANLLFGSPFIEDALTDNAEAGTTETLVWFPAAWMVAHLLWKCTDAVQEPNIHTHTTDKEDTNYKSLLHSRATR